MPPRYAYWTIIVDDQPTAFRAGALDDIMPTFNRLKEKQPTAKLMWFQSGKLWPSRIDAREAMQVRGERGRYSDPRQDGGGKTSSRERPKWKSKDFSAKPRVIAPGRTGSAEWKPKQSGARSRRGSLGLQALKPPSPQAAAPSAASRAGAEALGEAQIARVETQERPVSNRSGNGEATSAIAQRWKPKGDAGERPVLGPERHRRTPRMETARIKPSSP